MKSGQAIAEQVARDPYLMHLWQEVQQASMRRHTEKAKADPLANKNSRVFDSGVSANYRYYQAPKNGKGQIVRFCWSVHRNTAGFFLGWRETYRKNGTVKRDMWLSRRVKTRCIEIAARRAGVSTEEL